MSSEKAPTSRRDELVDIASKLFYEQGFSATGIKQVIDTAGIAKGTFYSHFSSKEEVGVEWLKKRHLQWSSLLEHRLEQSRGAKGKLLGLFNFLEDWMAESDFRGCAFLNTLAEIPDSENPMRHEIAHHKEQLRDSIQSLAIEHFSEKIASFAKQKGTIIFLLFEGALVESQNFRDPWPIAAARREVKALLTPDSSES